MMARTFKSRRFRDALLVVAKRPVPGRTKTRLSPPLTLELSAALYECFLLDTLHLVRRVPGVQPVIAFVPAEAAAYFGELAPDFEAIAQVGSDLGSRLDHALTTYLERGYERVVIMSSDGPTLPRASLVAAFEALRDGADVVVGPSDDGGYYLIGLKRPAPRLLREVRMSTSRTRADTLALAAEEGFGVQLLPSWYDVDDAAGLARLRAELAGAPPHVARHTRVFLEALSTDVRASIRREEGKYRDYLNICCPAGRGALEETPSSPASARTLE